MRRSKGLAKRIDAETATSPARTFCRCLPGGLLRQGGPVNYWVFDRIYNFTWLEDARVLTQLALALVMVMLIAIFHLVGLALLGRLLRSHGRTFRKLRIMPLTLLLTATTGIIGIHTVEIWLYATLYLGLGALGNFEEALYFSTVTYSTIGYGDVLLPLRWRILGAIEGAAGIIMLGWSTAYLVSLLTQMKLFSQDWLVSDD